MIEINFKPPGPVARAFMLDRSFVRGLRGPVGSAKSSTCSVECLRLMMLQEPSASGIRKTRTAVIRNTNPMLRTTTLNTWRDWIPEALGNIRMHPPPFEQEIILKLPDKTELAAEVYFLALDRPEDMKKLLSLELTTAWINEAREVGKTIVDGVTQRLRRFPRMQDGGPTRSGLIMDTNAPDDDHWWPIMAGDVAPPEGMSEDEIANLVKPDNWAFYNQPAALLKTGPGVPPISEDFCREMIARVAPAVRPAWEKKLDEIRAGLVKPIGYVLNPEAENIQNLHPDYYPEQIKGKAKAYIDVYILNRYGATHDGRAVHPEFSREMHVAKEPLEPWAGVPLLICADFGLTPAATISQKLRGRYQTLREIVLTDGDAEDLAKAINRVVAEDFPGFKVVRGWGDPAGSIRSQARKSDTPFKAVRAKQLPMRPVESNEPEIRRGAMKAVLTRLAEGRPMWQVDPRCKVLVAGLEGAWCYKRVHGAGERFHDEPDKNRYSHVCEAQEYLFVGEGEHRGMIGQQAKGEAKVVNVRAHSDPIARFQLTRRRAGSGIMSFGRTRMR